MDQIAETALDDDYYIERHSPQSTRPRAVVISVISVAIVAAIITVAAGQARSTRPSTSLERTTLARDIEQRRALLESRQTTVETLRDRISSLEQNSAGSQSIKNDRIIVGATAVTGPGVSVTISDASKAAAGLVTAADLRFVVNGLWAAGAEAVMLNGKRIGALSAIVPLQGGISVDYGQIGPPYQVAAIGDPERLKSEFENGPFGRYLDERESRDGLTWSVSRSTGLTMPAASDRRTTTTLADPIEERR